MKLAELARTGLAWVELAQTEIVRTELAQTEGRLRQLELELEQQITLKELINVI